MARLTVEGEGHSTADGDGVVVRLSWPEALLTRRRELRMPWAAVKAVAVEPDWWRALRGTAVTGRCSPGRYCVGERLHPFGRDLWRCGPACPCCSWTSGARTRTPVSPSPPPTPAPSPRPCAPGSPTTAVPLRAKAPRTAVEPAATGQPRSSSSAPQELPLLGSEPYRRKSSTLRWTHLDVP